MLMLAGKTKNREQAYTLLRSALVGGKALQKFRELVSAQGGDPRVVDEPRRLAQPRHAFTLKAHRRGYISGIDALAAGEAATMLGAGRRKKDDRIDYFVGIEFLRKRGAKLEKGDVIARIYATQRAEAKRCGELLRGAVEISPERPKPIPIVIGKSRGAKRAMRSPSR
jgi:pyrimidine-nucleoside phosphorylase